MSGIWHEVGGEHHIQPIAGQGYRLVESQESVATTEIVSNLEKQAILEDMIDNESKPGYCTGTEDLHYLLSTPFRYPPLQHGSRFGNKDHTTVMSACRKVEGQLKTDAGLRKQVLDLERQLDV